MRPNFDYEDLSTDECWTLLAATPVGRLAVDIAGHPDIFPINIVVDGRTIVFRSGAGTKLAGAVLNRHVAIEIDGARQGARVVWSVVLKGEAREIDAMQERYDAEDLPLFPWVSSPKPVFVRVEPESVTGRRFVVADEVDRPAEQLRSFDPVGPRRDPVEMLGDRR